VVYVINKNPYNYSDEGMERNMGSGKDEKKDWRECYVYRKAICTNFGKVKEV
jgi:hypothetical protein